MTYLSTLVLVALLAQAGAPAASPESKAKAQALLKEGAQFYQQGQFADALEKFEQAYAVFPSPKLLFNIGQASRDLGRPVEAVDAFEKFLAQATDPAPELVAEAKRSVAELSPKIGKLLIDCNVAGAAISVDGKNVGQAPLADMVRVSPGNHQLTATHPSVVPAVENVTVAAGTVQAIVLRPRSLAEVAATTPVAPPAPAPAPTLAPPVEVRLVPPTEPPATKQGWWLGRKWTWVAAGSAVLFAGGGTVAGLAMQSKFDELKSKCGSANPDAPACTSSDISSLDARRNTANVMWGLTAAAVVTTGVLFFLEGRPVAVAPMAGEVTGFVASARY
jgi:hypothetical protein